MKLEGVPEGYEAVRFGKAKAGELFIDSGGHITLAEINIEAERLIIRQQPPAVQWKHGVFNNGWIAKDSAAGSSRIWWFSKNPRQDNGKWEPDDDTECDEITSTCMRRDVIQFRDDVPWTECIVQVGPSVEDGHGRPSGEA